MFRKGGVFSQYSLNVSGWDHLHTDNLLKTVSETQLNCIIDQNPRHRTTADQAGHCQQHICDFIFPVKSESGFTGKCNSWCFFFYAFSYFIFMGCTNIILTSWWNEPSSNVIFHLWKDSNYFVVVSSPARQVGDPASVCGSVQDTHFLPGEFLCTSG